MWKLAVLGVVAFAAPEDEIEEIGFGAPVVEEAIEAPLVDTAELPEAEPEERRRLIPADDDKDKKDDPNSTDDDGWHPGEKPQNDDDDNDAPEPGAPGIVPVDCTTEEGLKMPGCKKEAEEARKWLEEHEAADDDGENEENGRRIEAAAELEAAGDLPPARRRLEEDETPIGLQTDEDHEDKESLPAPADCKTDSNQPGCPGATEEEETAHPWDDENEFPGKPDENEGEETPSVGKPADGEN